MLTLSQSPATCEHTPQPCQTLYPIICALAGGSRDNEACERIKEVFISLKRAMGFMPADLAQILQSKFPDGEISNIRVLVDPTARWSSAQSFLQVLDSELISPKKPVLILAYDGSVQEAGTNIIASPQVRKLGQWVVGVADHHHPKTIRSLSPTSGQQTDELLTMINSYLNLVEQINIDINDIDPDVVCPVVYTYIKFIWDCLSTEQKVYYKEYFESVFLKLDEVINYDSPIDRRIGVVDINEYSGNLELNKNRLLLHRYMFESVDQMRTERNRSLENYVNAMIEAFNRVAEYILDASKNFLDDNLSTPKPSWLSQALSVQYQPQIEVLDVHHNRDLASAIIREGNPGHRAIMVDSVMQTLKNRFPDNQCSKYIYSIVVNSNNVNTTVVYINQKPICLTNYNWTICGDPVTLNLFRNYINLLEEFFQLLFNQKTELDLEKMSAYFDFVGKPNTQLTPELITQILQRTNYNNQDPKSGNFCMADAQGDFGFLANHRVGSCYLTQTTMNYILSWFTQLHPSILKLDIEDESGKNSKYLHERLVNGTLSKLIYTIIQRELPNLLETSEQITLNPISTANIEKVVMH